MEESIRAMQEQAEAGTQAATQANNAKTAERRKAEAKMQQLLEETKVLETNNQASYQVPFRPNRRFRSISNVCAPRNEGAGTRFPLSFGPYPSSPLTIHLWPFSGPPLR